MAFLTLLVVEDILSPTSSLMLKAVRAPPFISIDLPVRWKTLFVSEPLNALSYSVFLTFCGALTPTQLFWVSLCVFEFGVCDEVRQPA